MTAAQKIILPPPLSLVELETVGSTNDHARQLAKNGYPSGIVVWAHEQTAGKGRQGNSWVSAPGNLFMSMILRPQANLSQSGQLSLMSAVALANVLAPLIPDGNKLSLKWPNDVLINEKKIAGILLETESQGLLQVPWVVVGIGVNIAAAPEGAVCLHDLGVKTHSAAQILELLSVEMHRLFKQWETGGFEDIRDEWVKRAYRINETITARMPKETLTGTFEGLDRTGALILKLPNGIKKAISSGDVFAGG